jgi:GT2 family glycosyltransferase
MIVRRAVLEQIGLMDEGYFLYFEEADFCWRAKAAGWEIWHVPESRVMHLEGASTGIRTKARRRAKYWYDSRRRFFVKHYGVTGLAMADILWTLGRTTLLFRRLFGLGGGSGGEDPAYFMYDLLWGDLKSFLTGQVLAIRRV